MLSTLLMLSACVDWDSIKSVQFFNGAVAHRLSSNNIEQIRCSGKPCTMIHINRFECVRTGPDRSGTLISQFHCSGEYLEDRGWRVSPSSDWSISCETCDPKMRLSRQLLSLCSGVVDHRSHLHRNIGAWVGCYYAFYIYRSDAEGVKCKTQKRLINFLCNKNPY